MTNRFENQYFSIIGDSISTYECYLPEDYPAFYTNRAAYFTNIHGHQDTWWGQVIDHFGAKLLVNNSWSGSYVCKPESCEIESYGCSDARTGGLGIDGIVPDQIIVFIGTNDRGAGFRLSSCDIIDLSVIEHAYGVMLDKIKHNYPEAEVWCCTFPITTCTRDPYFEFPQTHFGVPMENYGELIKKIATEKKCHIIDLWDKDELCDTIEGLHPNYNGMSMIARKVIKIMETTQKIDYRKNLFILSAPSATGKNTVFELLRERIPYVRRVTTATTRKPRKSEIEGVDYHFMSEGLFLDKVAAGNFVEHNLYDSGYYGTPVDEIEGCPMDVPLFLIIDTNGMHQVVKKYPNAKRVFLMPPSIEELERRIHARGDNTQEEIENRILQAKKEIAESAVYDYIIVNDDIEKCVEELVNIVQSTSL